jgi:hypothetical protein
MKSKNIFVASGVLLAVFASLLIGGLAHAHGFVFDHGISFMCVGMAIPSLSQLQTYSVNRAGAEGLRQTLFDFLLYPTPGQTQLNFFALPQGQGITSALGGTVGTSKTIGDTNMNVSGMLPAGQSYLITSIEALFFAGTSATANTFTLAAPGVFAAIAAAAVVAQINDVATFYSGGNLNLFIGSKSYLSESPLMRFPPKTQLTIDAAVASNSATLGESAVASAKISGRPYMVEPPIYLENNQNFVVSMNWPGAVATPSGFNGRVGVILDGYLYRNSQ